MNVEIKNDVYLFIFPKTPTMTIIYFVISKKILKTNKYLEWKYFMHKLYIWSLGMKVRPLDSLLL